MGHRTGLGRQPIAWVLAVGVVVSMLHAGVVFAEGRVGFGFNPPNGTTFVETLRFRKTVDQSGAPPQSQVTESETEYEIRKTHAGYSVYTRPVSLADLQLSGEAAGKLNSLISNMNLTYDLDEHGRLQRVRGVDTAIDQLIEATGFTQELFDMLLQAMGASQATLGDMVAYDFQRRELFSLMSGVTVELDQERTAQGRVPAPPGLMVDAVITRKVTGPFPCNGQRCARVEFTTESHDEAIGTRLAEGMRRSLIQMAQLLAPGEDVEKEIPVFTLTGSRMKTTTVRLIEPETHLPYSERSTLTITATFGVEGDPEPVQFNMTETRDYSYAYR